VVRFVGLELIKKWIKIKNQNYNNSIFFTEIIVGFMNQCCSVDISLYVCQADGHKDQTIPAEPMMVDFSH